MIRTGKKEDVPAIVEMAREFWKHTIYDEEFCEDTVAVMSELCIDNGLMSVLEAGTKVVGFACGIKGALLANCDVFSGTEVAWWVDEEHRKGSNGIGLLLHLEGLAKDAGIKYWNMVFMESSMPERIESIYNRMGYRKTETFYTKVI